MLETDGRKYYAFVSDDLYYLNGAGRLIHPKTAQIKSRSTRRNNRMTFYDWSGAKLASAGCGYDKDGLPAVPQSILYTADQQPVYPAKPDFDTSGNTVYPQFVLSEEQEDHLRSELMYAGSQQADELR